MFNSYEIQEETTTIFTIGKRGSKVHKILIDTEDLQKVQSYSGTWSTMTSKLKNDCIYAIIYGINNKGKPMETLMHRILFDIPKDKHVDHINHNTLDNRKANLRIASRSENQQNRTGAQKNSKSGIRGVYWSKTNNAWAGQIRLNGKRVWQRYFQDIGEAKQEIEKARGIYHPFAV